jgi:hypothetical protein
MNDTRGVVTELNRNSVAVRQRSGPMEGGKSNLPRINLQSTGKVKAQLWFNVAKNNGVVLSFGFN